MQLKNLKTILEPQVYLNRISGLLWSPNNQKLAVATADRSILLFDENGERRDKFSTKPADAIAGKKSYVIRGIAFSPDSTRLAVAQSDSIVYVYKLGELWNEKKVICNKFPQPSAVMAITWLQVGAIVVGLEDGKVRALHCRNNKSQNLYAADSMVISIASNSRGTGVITGHEDGSIIRYYIVEEHGESSGRVLTHSTAPYVLAWPQNYIVASGADKKILFYDSQGRTNRTFDYSRDDTEHEFMVAACSSNGQSVAVGSYDRVRIFSWSARQNTWSETAPKIIKNLYSVTALAWRRDGSILSVGSICGGVILFESVLKRTVWQDKFELTFVTPSQVLLKSLQETGEKMIVESQLGLEIDDVRIMGKDNYLVARTEDSLILCDLTRSMTSEVRWNSTGRLEKFYFENPNVCLIFNVGELSLVEYGDNDILGSVRTEFVNPHVISVRLNERGNSKNNKKLAYLLDMKTICVVDLISQSAIAQITHDSKIDWLELSETSHKLLFRDKKMRLVLVDVQSCKKQILLGKVSFVQWVPQSDVAVAQNDMSLAVWYNIDLPEYVSMMSVRGEVIDVTRDDGKTEVHTREGPVNHSYYLDEGLVEFVTAVNDSDFGRAILYLESLDDTPPTKGMWHNLANIALAKKNLRIAQRCYAALGNASKTFYISETIQVAEKYEETVGPDTECPESRARVSLLYGELRTAERIYLDQGDIESAIEMFQKLGKWNDAIKLAERRGYHKLKDLKLLQMSYLLESGQEEKAGEVLEENGEVDKAMTLYLKARKPARAARLSLVTPHLLLNEELMAQVRSSLVKSELFEIAGDLAQKLNDTQGAVTLYRKGGSYGRAIETARQISPDEVTMLEEEWGDWLVTKRQLDASISHYIEAGATLKALDAAMGAKQWRKAVQIAKVVDNPTEIKKYAIDLSEHLAYVGDMKGAENILLRAGLYREAIDLLNRNGKWEKAYEIAEQYLNVENVHDMFIQLADKLESEGKYRDAEKVYIAVNEADKAIAMYKRVEHYDAMIRLVEQFHKDLLENTHLHLAKQLESKGKYKQAEVHFIAAGNWKAVVHMYCAAGKWEDAHQIAKQKGGEVASNQVAFMWAKSLPIEGATRLLVKMGLLEIGIQLACESSQFNFALQLCKLSGRNAEDVHLKIAMSLEDDGKFNEAEVEFILANKPREAILMYCHSNDWESAMRVAEKHIPEAMQEILMNQAASALEANNYSEYETLLIRAERPNIVIQHYRENGMWNDALRVAREYAPGEVAELQRYQNSANRNTSTVDSRGLLESASEYARNEEFKKAVDCLLQITELNSDSSTVERALIRAAEISNQFLEGNEAVEVARDLCPRLVEINQPGPAAQLYLSVEMPKEAVDVFIKTENWNKARRLAKEIDPQLLAYVETQQKSVLKVGKNIEQLADIDIMSALDLLAEQGQWTRCIEKAKQTSSGVLHKYLAIYAAQLIRVNDPITALKLYLNHGVPAIPENFNIYQRISLLCFGLREPEGVQIWKNLRQFLYDVCHSIQSSQELANSEAFVKFDLLLLIAHYYATRSACRQVSALQQISVKISVALLRHSDIVPCDKAFYEAGMDLRSVGRESEAFVILNHYLDISEAIEDGTGNLVDHSDLAATDFPSSVSIPETLHLLNEDQLHEEVREWVLAISMDQRVDQTLPTDDRELFESSLGSSDQPCLITGYPILGKPPIVFQRSNRLASREAWSKLTLQSKMSPHTDLPEVVEFIEKWCGAANFISN